MNKRKEINVTLTGPEKKCFSCDAEAQIAIKQEAQWSRYFTNKTRNGIKVHYRCNKVRFRATKCNAAIHLFHPHDNDEVILFRGHNEHKHTDSNKCYFFSEEMKQNIQQLFDMRLKPKKIYKVLEERNFKTTPNQVKNYVNKNLVVLVYTLKKRNFTEPLKKVR